jgi:hypothetical protein
MYAEQIRSRAIFSKSELGIEILGRIISLEDKEMQPFQRGLRFSPRDGRMHQFGSQSLFSVGSFDAHREYGAMKAALDWRTMRQMYITVDSIRISNYPSPFPTNLENGSFQPVI